ncbi:MAG: sulfite exporter TauE/SafE family protein [Acutalibacteraceae bacterium]|nr:sulfite exporter TauE/SafE family protein [Acutalibacteraceae bacterium]
MEIVKLIAGFLSGIIGGMGLGGGAVLLIYLRVFGGAEQINAQGINLLFFIPIGLTAVIFYSFKKMLKWKTVIPFALFACLGAVGGYYLGQAVGGEYLGKFFGGILIILGFSEIIKGFHLKKDKKGGNIKKE